MNSRSLFGDIFSKYKTWIFFTILAAAVTSVCNVLATLKISNAIDCFTDINNAAMATFSKILITLIILYVIIAIADWIVAALSNKIAFAVSRDLRHKVFDKLGRLPLSYFDSTPHGDIVSRFTNDINSISDALSLGLTSLFSGIVTIITVLIVMFTLSPKITAVVLAVTPITFFVAWVVARASQNTFREQQKAVGKMTGFISEMIGNQKTVKAFSYEKESTKQFEAINADLKKISTKAHFASAMINPSTRVVDHTSYILVGVVGAFIAIATGLSVGTISAFLMFSGQFAKPFNEFSGIMTNLQTAAASLTRVNEILNEYEETADLPSAVNVKTTDGNVAFNHVDFSYDKSTPLIQNLDLRAEAGNLVAIVGPTGAGKTTIVNLLMRFYEIDKGEICLDDHNIVDLTKDSLRKSFAMVLQETWLFYGTIKENISYGKPDATDDEVILASKAAYSHNFIKQLPDGYDTIISEDGGNLSQGQKQLLTIARVMLTNPSMLILDEATSSIDTLTEIRVQRAFLELMHNRTSFVIAHRLSTIVQADTILVLDKGQIVEKGTHKELIAKKGFYFTLYQSQFE